MFTISTFRAFALPGTLPLGRGGHQMLVVVDTKGNPFLWAIGGRGGDNTVNGRPEVSVIVCE